jgi:hypothetical protein
VTGRGFLALQSGKSHGSRFFATFLRPAGLDIAAHLPLPTATGVSALVSALLLPVARDERCQLGQRDISPLARGVRVDPARSVVDLGAARAQAVPIQAATSTSGIPAASSLDEKVWRRS